MRLVLKIFLCLCFLPASIFCQEQIRQVKIGQNNNETRIFAVLIQPTETAFKTQSMIIDFKPLKKSKDLPESFTVDLTSTVRSLKTGAKNQKILNNFDTRSLIWVLVVPHLRLRAEANSFRFFFVFFQSVS